MYFPCTAPPPRSCSRSATAVQGCCTQPAQARSLTLILQAPSPKAMPAPLPRNTAGQIIKPCIKAASSSRTQSAKPQIPRFVHFGASLEHIRWFYKTEAPECASANPAGLDIPSAHTTAGFQGISAIDLATPNAAAAAAATLVAINKPAPSFSAYEPSPVVLETVVYNDGALSGSIKVHNIAFEKSVVVRLTKDNWKSVQDIPATFLRSIFASSGSNGASRPGVDRFRFVLPLGDLCSSSPFQPTNISMCVRYQVAGQDHWDNNGGANYSFKFVPAQPTKPTTASSPAAHSVDNDAVVLRKKPSNFGSYSFDCTVDTRRPRNAAPSLSAAATPSASAGSVTGADTRRYMRFSEAKFSAPASETTTQSLVSALTSSMPQPFKPTTASTPTRFSSLPWSTQSYGGVYPGEICHTLSPLYPSSPVMRLDSPLASSPVWSSYPTATLLHC
ncbi:hypothetical protein GGI07_000322 [Coemansia sp. Benny D115]|nr:hypothetical protein GGI07_000322 [Coemansia sp. Benny D115]